MTSVKRESCELLDYDLGLLSRRRFPVGAEVLRQGGVHFRVWATRCQRVTAVIQNNVNSGAPVLTVTLMPEGNGYFSGVVPSAGAGMLYWVVS